MDSDLHLNNAENTGHNVNPAKIINEYLVDRSEAFVALTKVRELGWKDPRGDAHFQKQRTSADNADRHLAEVFFNTMRDIGNELETETGVIQMKRDDPQILDTCAAPGGFISMALDHNPTAHVCAMTLPTKLGGHSLLVPYGTQDSRVTVSFVDITTLGLEYGLRPEELGADMCAERPYLHAKFDMAFCDGQLLRTNKQFRAIASESCASRKLAYSQLIFGMNRLRNGGTLVMLLHKAEAWDTMCILFDFAKFSHIQLHKPRKAHITRNSFYLIAKNVQSESEVAQAVINEWKAEWRAMTIGQELPDGQASRLLNPDIQAVNGLLEDFGQDLIYLAEPIWKTQKNAIERAPWFRDSSNVRSSVHFPRPDTGHGSGTSMA